MEDIKLFTACKALIERDGKLLMLRESSQYVDGTQVGKLDFPGGRLQPGERFDAGLVREVKEETGLTVHVQTPFYVDEWRPKVRDEHWQIVGVFFDCRANEGDVVLSGDHMEAVWVDPASYEGLEIIPMYKTLLDAYAKRA